MDQHILAGNPPIAVNLRRSARARRFSLRVSRIDGRVTLTVPKRARLDEGLAFLRERRDWIAGCLAEMPEERRPELGGRIPIAGMPVEIRAAPGSPRQPMRLHEGSLLAPGGQVRLGPRVGAFLKAEARARLLAAAEAHALRLGRKTTGLSLRDPRGRWGSCSSSGRLMFSWRLVMAPADVLDYVAAHEVAHLAEMNHSPAFWAEVAALCPGYEAPRAWLRREGAGLHRWRFED